MTKNGYTLIEILVGITIIGILFGIGYVSFREFSRRQAVAGAAKQIRGDLRLAQEQALAGKKPEGCASKQLDSYSFSVSLPRSYTVQASCATDPSKSVTLSSDLTIVAPSPNPITFKALGQGTNISQSGTATLTLTQAGTNNRVDITVTAGGEIK